MNYITTLKSLALALSLSLSMAQASNRELVPGQSLVTPTQVGGFGGATPGNGDPLNLDFGFRAQRGGQEVTHHVGVSVAPQVLTGLEDLLGATRRFVQATQTGVRVSQSTTIAHQPQPTPFSGTPGVGRSLEIPSNPFFRYNKDGEIKTITQAQIDVLNRREDIKISIEYVSRDWNGMQIQERSLFIKKLVARDIWSTEIYPVEDGQSIPESRFPATSLRLENPGFPLAVVTQPQEQDLKPCAEGLDYIYFTASRSYHISTESERGFAGRMSGVQFAIDDKSFYIFDTDEQDPRRGNNPVQRKLRAQYLLLPAGRPIDLSEYTEVGMNGESLAR